MKLLRRVSGTAELSGGCVATIGNFDGVHRGHQALLAALKVQASRMQLPVVVLLFEPQPGEYFNLQDAPARLYRLREKIDALRKCGVDFVCCLKFDLHLAGMSPDVFAEQIVFSRLNAKYL
jgi:riboflavin kinase/FMN adenylyltransferase